MSIKLSTLQKSLIPVVFDLPIYDDQGNIIETVEHVSFRKALTRNELQANELKGLTTDAELLASCIVKTGFEDDEGKEIPPSIEFFGNLEVLVAGAWAQAVMMGQTKKRSTA